MFTFLGIVFATVLLTMLALICCNASSSQYTDSIFEDTNTAFLTKAVIILLLIGTTVCWLKACS